ncbi:MAG: tyrosine-type recombinase/integrase, partial [Bryobacteraceae bacterium]
MPAELAPPPSGVAKAPTLAQLEAAFAAFLRIDVASGDASPETIRSYRNEVARWVAWCHQEDLDPARVSVAEIKRYRAALIQAGYRPVTVRWKLTILRRFYEAARNAGLRADNPAAGVKGPRLREAAENFKFLTDEQLGQLLAQVPDPDQASGRERAKRLRNRVMLELMALHGLRTVEVHRANVEDLSERGGHTALPVRGKTRDRIVYLRPDTAVRLRQYLDARGPVGADAGGTPLFVAVGNHHGGQRLSRRHIRVQTDTCLALAGLKRPGISKHALRHTAGTLGYLHTGDLRAVQELLGHADPRMTARYAHVVDMAKRNPALFIPVKAERGDDAFSRRAPERPPIGYSTGRDRDTRHGQFDYVA